MKVAVYSADAVLARMLQLEAGRCGYEHTDAGDADVSLVDLDHPVSQGRHASAVKIGFAAHPETLENSTREGLYAVLPLPFSARELDAVLARCAPQTERGLQREGDTLRLGGKRLHFSKTEQALLTYLYDNRHRTVTTEEISTILGESAQKSNAAAVYLYRLRRKLEEDGCTRIRTVRGAGYRWMGE